MKKLIAFLDSKNFRKWKHILYKANNPSDMAYVYFGQLLSQLWGCKSFSYGHEWRYKTKCTDAAQIIL